MTWCPIPKLYLLPGAYISDSTNHCLSPRGSKGSLTIDQIGISEIPGLMILSKVDTVGAGDSYLAGAASALAAGYSMEIAATIGTFVAGVTVQKLFQTGTATPEEILAIGEDPDFIYSIRTG